MMNIAWDNPNNAGYFLMILVVIYLLFRLHQWRKKVRQAYADSNLQEEVFQKKLPSILSLKSIFLLIAMIFMVLALMGPMWGEEEQSLKREGIDLVFALDLSSSMDAEDIAPSRLEKAKQFIINYLESLGGDRVGLVIFAGEAYSVSPLTTDYVALTNFVQNLETRLIWNQGTNISAAIETSIEVVGDAKETSKAIILISDGEDHEEGLRRQIDKAIENRIEIFSLGIGSTVPVPIPIRSDDGFDLGYKENDRGSTVLTTFHGETLRRIAQSTGGSYMKIENLDRGVEQLKNQMRNLERKAQQEITTYNKKQQYQWFLGVAILFYFIYTLTPDNRFLNT